MSDRIEHSVGIIEKIMKSGKKYLTSDMIKVFLTFMAYCCVDPGPLRLSLKRLS